MTPLCDCLLYLYLRACSKASTPNTRNSRSRSQQECYFTDLQERVKLSSPRSSPKSSGVDSSRRIWESSDHLISIRQPRISRTFLNEQKKLPRTNRSYSSSMRSTLSYPLARAMSTPTRPKKSLSSSRSSTLWSQHRTSSSSPRPIVQIISTLRYYALVA